MKWTARDAGDLTGRRILVTGGNSGIGLEAARALAHAGASVVIACRNLDKGKAAVADIAADHPGADVSLLELDLADLTSVDDAAQHFCEQHDWLDVLVNNAGVMALPYRQTVDGFEMQFGTNHLGHFALTGHLLDTLLKAPAPRVVTVSSGMHRFATGSLDNVDASKGYRKWEAYSTSKLANLLFTYELHRRTQQAGSNLVAVAAHPGYAHTNLQTAGPQMSGSKIGEAIQLVGAHVLGQSSQMGALPTVYAAVASGVRSGDFIGPGGLAGMRGYPRTVHSTRKSHDPEIAAQLWRMSEDLTGVRYDRLSR
jgi:NAD(P)-dependent dehydrogenase (short-subunit alcohol dehydrogenase family)